MVGVDVLPLLIPAVLGDDEIHVADGLEQRRALLIGEITAFVLLVTIELVGGQRHDEIVTLRLGAAQEIDVPIVQQVECAIGDDTFHLISSLIL